MHIDHSIFPGEYALHVRKRTLVVVATSLLLIAVSVLSICFGAVSIPLKDVVGALVGQSDIAKWNSIIFDIRLPRILTAVFAGTGLAASGVVMQSVLRNPLASPFTLGISQAAAFGAALSVMVLGTGVLRSTGATAITITDPYTTTGSAFLFCLLTTALIIGLSRLRRTSPEVMVLAGVALGSLFASGTMFLQFFADDVQLAAIVFWTFGDVGRTSFEELFIIMAVVSAACLFFFSQRWKYNALDCGDETAKSLGVAAERVRVANLIVASLVTSAIIAFVGIIGFVGLICPHMVRRLVGDDHRFLFPAACFMGGVVLVASDTAARLILIPHVFPVAILTSFLGVPVFIFLLVRGRPR